MKPPLVIEDILWEKIRGASNKEIGKRYGRCASTIGKLLKPYQTRQSLANAIYKDYVVNAHLMKLKPHQVAEIENWIRANIVTLCSDSKKHLSIGQADYKSRKETYHRENFSDFVDWLSIHRGSVQ